MGRRNSKSNEENIIVPRFQAESGFYTCKSRSRLMSKIRAKNTKPEMRLRRALWAKNMRYRLHDTGLAGSPDIVIRKYSLVVFVDGSFWHGYQWERKKGALKTNEKFWIPKIERNIQRDRVNNEILRSAGYTVMRFWDHDINNKLDACVNQILLYIEAHKMGPIPEFD